MKKKINRRDFIKTAIALGGVATAALANIKRKAVSHNSSTVFLPNVLRYEPTDEPSLPLPPGSGGVVQVHADDALAAGWNFQADYWNYVDQAAVDRMVDEGIRAMTGLANLTSAWKSLIPNYRSGEVVAIKVSFNNGDKADDTMLDANIQPVNAIIRGLNLAGVPFSSIVVFDSQRPIRQRFINACAYQGVVFRDRASEPWDNASEPITFRPPSQSAVQQRISKEVVNARYLINVPVLKRHGGAGVSMGLKNHFGTISDPGSIHEWTVVGGNSYPNVYNRYSPIVELNLNPNIRDKTILIVGDALFGGFDNNSDGSKPARWATFNNQSPKSLFFSKDPVAVDCVMSDLLQAELIVKGWPLDTRTLAHLSLAEQAGLGICELGDPWKNSYTRIQFDKIEL